MNPLAIGGALLAVLLFRGACQSLTHRDPPPPVAVVRVHLVPAICEYLPLRPECRDTTTAKDRN